jgi:hypothetical protein
MFAISKAKIILDMLFKFYKTIQLLSSDLFKKICFLAWSRDRVNLRIHLIITICMRQLSKNKKKSILK